MKLSAPPPPPPEPPEPGPQPTPEPQKDAGVTAQPTGEPVTVAAPAPVAVPKPATWPAWFGAVDAVLAGLAVALGFLVASFAARNADLWLHLGAGRMLTTGEYKLGSDPFSYTAADRTWVNHNWLFDLGAYLLYRDDGFVLVLAKALAVGAAVGLLLGIRRPGHALWPWAVLAVLAVLAAAPRLTLNPLVGSVLFLALTLFLVFRVTGPPGSWRLPAAVGVTFWVWANVDQWFFIGPAALALLVIGDLARKYALKGGPPPADADDSLGPLPDTKTLIRALAVGVVACMLNPHHVRVWALPVELVGAGGIETDPRFQGLLTSPLNARYWQSPYWGNNVNGISYALLLLTGVYVTFLSGAFGRFAGGAAEIDPLPLPHTLLWLGFATLSLLTVYAIPFLAVVTVPLVASRLNVLSAHVRLGSRTDRKTRLVLTASGAGRVASALGVLALGVVAWAGWLHPPASSWQDSGPVHPARARPVTWAVEPDPGMTRAAHWLAEQRSAGRLPADARGLIASIELANYCAWFAPQEKVFLNGRLGHHRAELPEFVRVGRGLGLIEVNEEVPDFGDAAEVIDRNRVGYVAVSTGSGDADAFRLGVGVATFQMMRAWAVWAPWYLDGRTTIAGWRAARDQVGPAFERLRLDPVRLAFAPGVERLPPGRVEPVPPPRVPLDDFIRPARLAPPEADEVFAWAQYNQVMSQRGAIRWETAALLRLNVPGIAVPPLAQARSQAAQELSQGRANPRPRDEADMAVSILALRAARRAIARNPDSPDGYSALALALSDSGLPIAESERSLGLVTAYRQCLVRLPPPAEVRRASSAASPARVALQLVRSYLNPAQNGVYQGAPIDLPVVRELVGQLIVVQGNRSERVPLVALRGGLPAGFQVVPNPPSILPLDLARRALTDAVAYARSDPSFSPADLKQLETEQKRLDRDVQGAVERFRAAAEKQSRVRDRFHLALRTNLVGEALELLAGLKGDFEPEFGQDAPQVALQMIALMLAVGHLEDAAANIADLKAGFDRIATQAGAQATRVGEYRFMLRQLEYQKMLLEGDYAGAGAELEAINGPAIERITSAPPPPPEVGFDWPVVTAPAGLASPAHMALWYRLRLVAHANARQEVANRMSVVAEFFFRRGYLSLVEGDIAAAKQRFQQSRRTAPPGWDVPDVVLPAVPVYLRAIEAAEKDPTGP